MKNIPAEGKKKKKKMHIHQSAHLKVWVMHSTGFRSSSWALGREVGIEGTRASGTDEWAERLWRQRFFMSMGEKKSNE